MTTLFVTGFFGFVLTGEPALAKPTEYQMGETFKLGDFSYKILSCRTLLSITHALGEEKADPGAVFLVVKHEITNQGRKTATVSTQDFVVHDSKNRQFRTSTRAGIAAQVEDFTLAELQPGITRAGAQYFEIPYEEAATARLAIPKKGFFAMGTVSVRLTCQ